MQGNANQPSNTVDTLAIVQAGQDQYIAQRLPAWIAQLGRAEYRYLSEGAASVAGLPRRLVGSVGEAAQPG